MIGWSAWLTSARKKGATFLPEDVGGVSGYAHFLEAWRKRSHPEHQQMRQWVGKHFQPELFSVQQVNAALALFISLSSKP
jgi:hypothetical protein